MHESHLAYLESSKRALALNPLASRLGGYPSCIIITWLPAFYEKTTDRDPDFHLMAPGSWYRYHWPKRQSCHLYTLHRALPRRQKKNPTRGALRANPPGLQSMPVRPVPSERRGNSKIHVSETYALAVLHVQLKTIESGWNIWWPSRWLWFWIGRETPRYWLLYTRVRGCHCWKSSKWGRWKVEERKDSVVFFVWSSRLLWTTARYPSACGSISSLSSSKPLYGCH